MVWDRRAGAEGNPRASMGLTPETRVPVLDSGGQDNLRGHRESIDPPAAWVRTQKSAEPGVRSEPRVSYGPKGGRSVAQREHSAFIQPGPPQTRATVCTDRDGRPGAPSKCSPTEPRSECALTACQRDGEREAAFPQRPASGRGRQRLGPDSLPGVSLNVSAESTLLAEG